MTTPNHALQRTRRERRGCNRCLPCAGSLSLGRSTNHDQVTESALCLPVVQPPRLVHQRGPRNGSPEQEVKAEKFMAGRWGGDSSSICSSVLFFCLHFSACLGDGVATGLVEPGCCSERAVAPWFQVGHP